MTAYNIYSPLLNWPGSKRRDVNQIVRYFPSKATIYVEPFIGSAVVLLTVLRRQIITAKRFIAGDLNPRLIAFYRMVQKDPEAVCKEAETLFRLFWATQAAPKGTTQAAPKGTTQAAPKGVPPRPITVQNIEAGRKFFKKTLARLQETPLNAETPLIAAMYLFINRTAFGGMCRMEEEGKKCPFAAFGGKGLRKSSVNAFPNRIQEFAQDIQGVEFICLDAESLIEKYAKKGAFVYMDPPYPSPSGCSTSIYARGEHLTAQPLNVVHLCEMITQKGAAFALSFPRMTLSFSPLLKKNIAVVNIGTGKVKVYGLSAKSKGQKRKRSTGEMLVVSKNSFSLQK